MHERFGHRLLIELDPGKASSNTCDDPPPAHGPQMGHDGPERGGLRPPAEDQQVAPMGRKPWNHAESGLPTGDAPGPDRTAARGL